MPEQAAPPPDRHAPDSLRDRGGADRGGDWICRDIRDRRPEAQRGRRFRPAARRSTLAHKLAPLAHGEVAALTMATAPLRLPDLAFEDADGKPRKLSDWRGRTVLVNLWATWCVPCRREMPALESLQTKLGGPDFQVVAVNIDTRDPDKPRNFLKDANLTRLGFFSDQKAKVFQDLKSIGRALGMPTSVLVDGQGCEIATIAGPADWASDDADQADHGGDQTIGGGVLARPRISRLPPIAGAEIGRRWRRLSRRAGSRPRISPHRRSISGPRSRSASAVSAAWVDENAADHAHDIHTQHSDGGTLPGGG